MNHKATDAVRTAPYRVTTFSELLLGVTALVVLALLLVPAWAEYRVRERVAQCLHRLQPVQSQIVSYHRMLGEWPEKLRIDPIAPYLVNEYCEGFTGYDPASGAFMVNVNEGAIDPALPRLQPQLTPVPGDGGELQWVCSRGGTSPMQVRYLPSECRGLQRG